MRVRCHIHGPKLDCWPEINPTRKLARIKQQPLLLNWTRLPWYPIVVQTAPPHGHFEMVMSESLINMITNSGKLFVHLTNPGHLLEFMTNLLDKIAEIIDI